MPVFGAGDPAAVKRSRTAKALEAVSRETDPAYQPSDSMAPFMGQLMGRRLTNLEAEQSTDPLSAISIPAEMRSSARPDLTNTLRRSLPDYAMVALANAVDWAFGQVPGKLASGEGQPLSLEAAPYLAMQAGAGGAPTAIAGMGQDAAARIEARGEDPNRQFGKQTLGGAKKGMSRVADALALSPVPSLAMRGAAALTPESVTAPGVGQFAGQATRETAEYAAAAALLPLKAGARAYSVAKILHEAGAFGLVGAYETYLQESQEPGKYDPAGRHLRATANAALYGMTAGAFAGGVAAVKAMREKALKPAVDAAAEKAVPAVGKFAEPTQVIRDGDINVRIEGPSVGSDLVPAPTTEWLDVQVPTYHDTASKIGPIQGRVYSKPDLETPGSPHYFEELNFNNLNADLRWEFTELKGRHSYLVESAAESGAEYMPWEEYVLQNGSPQLIKHAIGRSTYHSHVRFHDVVSASGAKGRRLFELQSDAMQAAKSKLKTFGPEVVKESQVWSDKLIAREVQRGIDDGLDFIDFSTSKQSAKLAHADKTKLPHKRYDTEFLTAIKKYGPVFQIEDSKNTFWRLPLKKRPMSSSPVFGDAVGAMSQAAGDAAKYTKQQLDSAIEALGGDPMKATKFGRNLAQLAADDPDALFQLVAEERSKQVMAKNAKNLVRHSNPAPKKSEKTLMDTIRDRQSLLRKKGDTLMLYDLAGRLTPEEAFPLVGPNLVKPDTFLARETKQAIAKQLLRTPKKQLQALVDAHADELGKLHTMRSRTLAVKSASRLGRGGKPSPQNASAVQQALTNAGVTMNEYKALLNADINNPLRGEGSPVVSQLPNQLTEQDILRMDPSAITDDLADELTQENLARLRTLREEVMTKALGQNDQYASALRMGQSPEDFAIGLGRREFNTPSNVDAAAEAAIRARAGKQKSAFITPDAEDEARQLLDEYRANNAETPGFADDDVMLSDPSDDAVVKWYQQGSKEAQELRVSPRNKYVVEYQDRETGELVQETLFGDELIERNGAGDVTYDNITELEVDPDMKAVADEVDGIVLGDLVGATYEQTRRVVKKLFGPEAETYMNDEMNRLKSSGARMWLTSMILPTKAIHDEPALMPLVDTAFKMQEIEGELRSRTNMLLNNDTDARRLKTLYPQIAEQLENLIDSANQSFRSGNSLPQAAYTSQLATLIQQAGRKAGPLVQKVEQQVQSARALVADTMERTIKEQLQYASLPAPAQAQVDQLVARMKSNNWYAPLVRNGDYIVMESQKGSGIIYRRHYKTAAEARKAFNTHQPSNQQNAVFFFDPKEGTRTHTVGGGRAVTKKVSAASIKNLQDYNLYEMTGLELGNNIDLQDQSIQALNNALASGQIGAISPFLRKSTNIPGYDKDLLTGVFGGYRRVMHDLIRSYTRAIPKNTRDSLLAQVQAGLARRHGGYQKKYMKFATDYMDILANPHRHDPTIFHGLRSGIHVTYLATSGEFAINQAVQSLQMGLSEIVKYGPSGIKAGMRGLVDTQGMFGIPGLVGSMLKPGVIADPQQFKAWIAGRRYRNPEKAKVLGKLVNMDLIGTANMTDAFLQPEKYMPSATLAHAGNRVQKTLGWWLGFQERINRFRDASMAFEIHWDRGLRGDDLTNAVAMHVSRTQGNYNWMFQPNLYNKIGSAALQDFVSLPSLFMRFPAEQYSRAAELVSDFFTPSKQLALYPKQKVNRGALGKSRLALPVQMAVPLALAGIGGFNHAAWTALLASGGNPVVALPIEAYLRWRNERPSKKDILKGAKQSSSVTTPVTLSREDEINRLADQLGAETESGQDPAKRRLIKRGVFGLGGIKFDGGDINFVKNLTNPGSLVETIKSSIIRGVEAAKNVGNPIPLVEALGGPMVRNAVNYGRTLNHDAIEVTVGKETQSLDRKPGMGDLIGELLGIESYDKAELRSKMQRAHAVTEARTRFDNMIDSTIEHHFEMDPEAAPGDEEMQTLIKEAIWWNHEATRVFGSDSKYTPNQMVLDIEKYREAMRQKVRDRARFHGRAPSLKEIPTDKDVQLKHRIQRRISQ